MIAPYYQELPGISVEVHPYEEDNPGCWLATVTPEIGPDRRPTLEAWLSVEFLAWIVRDYRRSGYDIGMLASSPPPYWNTPGTCMRYIILGSDHEDGGPTLDVFAAAVDEHYRERYVSAAEIQAEVN